MPNVNVDRLLAEMEETERRHDLAAYNEWLRMRQAGRVPLNVKPLHYLVIGIIALGLAGYLLDIIFTGWHF